MNYRYICFYSVIITVRTVQHTHVCTTNGFVYPNGPPATQRTQRTQRGSLWQKKVPGMITDDLHFDV